MAPAIYVENGLDSFLEKIRAGVNEVPDLSTAKGRARIASLAAQVSRSKTAVEKPGRDYLKRLKEQPKVVEAELRRFVTECDQLRDEVRRPLTEWEDAEKARTEALQQRLVDLRALADVIDTAGNYLPSADIQARILEAKSVVLDDSWQERAAEAGVAKDSTIQKLEASLVIAQKREHEAAELDRLRKEAEEKARLEREENIRREAAEQAKRDAEAKAQAEIDAAARRESEARAATERAEREKIEAQQKAEREAKAAAEKAEQEKNAAIAAERRRQEEAESARLAEQKRIAEEEARRAADKEHRRSINRQAIADLIESGLTQEMAEKALIAIASGKVSAVSIKY
ncbi:TolA protein [Klebsiella pneumoniae]|nr:TolA protein [Klebsiella pneumoniae]